MARLLNMTFKVESDGILLSQLNNSNPENSEIARG